MDRDMYNAVVSAFEKARDNYNTQHIPAMYQSRHSQSADRSVGCFGAALLRCKSEKALLDKIIARLRKKHSVWDSDQQTHKYSFNTHFIEALRHACPVMYKKAVAVVYRIHMHGGNDVVLYRADTRSPSVIFEEGFRTRSFIGDATNRRVRFAGTINHRGGCVITEDKGVSTSKLETAARSFLHRRGGYLYELRFPGATLDKLALRPVDIHKTWKGSLINLRNKNKRRAEVNFIDSIPPEYIASSRLNGDGTAIINPKAITQADVPASSESATVNQVYDAVRGTIRIVGYSSEIQLYKGQKQRFHAVFDNQTDANRFIRDHDLRSERNPDQFKGVDARRYHGLFAVRLNQQQYQHVRASHNQFPEEGAIKLAPAFTSN